MDPVLRKCDEKHFNIQNIFTEKIFIEYFASGKLRAYSFRILLHAEFAKFPEVFISFVQFTACSHRYYGAVNDLLPKHVVVSKL